jgi:hypothetical protein
MFLVKPLMSFLESSASQVAQTLFVYLGQSIRGGISAVLLLLTFRHIFCHLNRHERKVDSYPFDSLAIFLIVNGYLKRERGFRKKHVKEIWLLRHRDVLPQLEKPFRKIFRGWWFDSCR